MSSCTAYILCIASDRVPGPFRLFPTFSPLGCSTSSIRQPFAAAEPRQRRRPSPAVGWNPMIVWDDRQRNARSVRSECGLRRMLQRQGYGQDFKCTATNLSISRRTCQCISYMSDNMRSASELACFRSTFVRRNAWEISAMSGELAACPVSNDDYVLDPKKVRQIERGKKRAAWGVVL